jgi:hypothetical protein
MRCVSSFKLQNTATARTKPNTPCTNSLKTEQFRLREMRFETLRKRRSQGTVNSKLAGMLGASRRVRQGDRNYGALVKNAAPRKYLRETTPAPHIYKHLPYF